ncbi:MAG: cysteine--tRNA ligase [Myxococcota bacterium]
MLQVHNTRTKKKEPFVPAHPKVVRIYTCGLTVYAPMHIGHARTYCFWDTFRRYLEYRGFHVVSVINYTDIDDRIMAAATGKDTDGTGCLDVAERFSAAFRKDCAALHIKDYAAYTRATDFVEEQVAHIAKLIETKHAYVVNGEVFYDVQSFPEYGQLSGKVVEEQEVGASGRVEEDFSRKRNPADFTLWKPSAPGQPTWQTGYPDWPQGRPGWHIECSAMSTTMLGDNFDVHGGGIDNLFPHHENEVAQSQPLCAHPWVRYWLHPEHLDLRDDETGKSVKMSKSLGNVVSVPDLLAKFPYDEIRWFMSSSHYRTKLQIGTKNNQVTWELVESAIIPYRRAKKLLSTLRERLTTLPSLERGGDYASLRSAEGRVPRMRHLYELGAYQKETTAFITEFQAAMDDDLNGPRASAAVNGYVSALYAGGIEKNEDPASLLAVYRALARHLWVFGIDEVDDRLYPELAADTVRAASKAESKGGDAVVDRLLELRKLARQAKDFAKGDAIRNLLIEAGVEVEDLGAKGTRWSLK